MRIQKAVLGSLLATILVATGLSRAQGPTVPPFGWWTLKLTTEQEKQANAVLAKYIPKSDLLNAETKDALLKTLSTEQKAQLDTYAKEAKSANNLKQILLALQTHHDAYGKMPRAAICDKNHKPLLSWRVAILPFIGENEDKLYQQFKLDEPWDSAHNKALLPRRPEVFAPPNGKSSEKDSTYYQIFTGKEMPFHDQFSPAWIPAAFPDGPSFTVLVAEAATAVPWTKPADIEVVAGKEIPKLGGMFEQGFHAATADGAVHFLRRDYNPELMRILVMPDSRDKRKIDAIGLSQAQVQANSKYLPLPIGWGRLELATEQQKEANAVLAKYIPMRALLDAEAKVELFKILSTEQRAHLDTYAKEALPQSQSETHLMQIMLALHMHHDVYGQMPKAASRDKNHKPLLSWRVAILPFIGENEDKLYQQFKLDEPWDSEHNKQLLARMPQVFAPPMGKSSEEYSTYYQVFTGKETPFNELPGAPNVAYPWFGGPRYPATFTDGVSNTVLVAEAATAVPWTKPADIEVVAGKEMPKLGALFKQGFHAGTADGFVHFLRRDYDPELIRILVMAASGDQRKAAGAAIRKLER